MAKIFVAGSINMDLVIETPKVPQMGETIMGSGFTTICGGKGANQAVTMSRLGCDVIMCGAVGNDVFGAKVLENLKNNRINCDNIDILDNEPSGIAIIVLNQGDNSIIVDSGANYKITPKRIRELESVIASCSMVVCQMEILMETILELSSLAKKNNIPFLLNPAPATEISKELMENISIITPNETEAEIITGIKIDNIDDAKKAGKCLLDRGVEQVVITLGKNGCVYSKNSEFIHMPAMDAVVVDTTAAGDAFTGAIATMLTQGYNIDEAIVFATAVSAKVVSKKGAQSSLPFLKDISI